MTKGQVESVEPRDEAEDLALTLGRTAHERKAEDVVILDLRKICSYTDFVLILSGRSTRQVQAIARHILREAKKLQIKPFGQEGLEQGQWVLLDFGPVVIHIFLEETRQYYDLDGLWQDAPRHDWPSAGPPPDLKINQRKPS